MGRSNLTVTEPKQPLNKATNRLLQSLRLLRKDVFEVKSEILDVKNQNPTQSC